MVVLIISSTIDPASTNIKNHLLKQTKWKQINTFNDNPVLQHTKMKDILLITINDRKITHENLDKEIEEKLKIKPKQAIFISRHTSKTGKPTLTVHPVGNYKEAKFGGKPKTLVKSSPHMTTQLLRIIEKNATKAKLYHNVCFEVTHHGPYLKIPTLFAEIGSIEEEWIKPKSGEILAKSILELLEKSHYEEDFSKDIPILIGVGGGHYAPRFTDVILEKNASFGHMIPAYHLNPEEIDENIFEKAIKETPNLSGVYIHRKSLKKPQIREYRNWFTNHKIPVFSSKELPDL